MFWNSIEMVVEQHCESSTKCHGIVDSKMVDFMLYQGLFHLDF